MIPHRMIPHRMIPHRMIPHRIGPYRIRPYRLSPYRLSPYRLSPYRIGTTDWQMISIFLQRVIAAAGACFCCFVTGCGVWPEFEPYGAVDSPDFLRSLNGVGVHRRMWESTGAKVLLPQKLSPRLDTVETIVLVGQSHDPPGMAARDWLEKWLKAKNGRTVIYFGRDFNAEVYYRERTLADLSADQRPRGEDLLATVEATELAKLMNEVPESTFCGWFYIDRQVRDRNAGKLRGNWSGGLNELDGQWPVRTTLLPPRSSFKNNLPSWIANNTAVTTNVPVEWTSDEVQRSIWTPTELGTKEDWNDAFKDLLESEVLLTAEDGTPLIFRLTHPQRLPGSQILVVANGAPFLNGSLVEPLHQQVAETLINDALPAERVALLSYDRLGILISTAPEADPRGAGLEMLTTWPLSAMTMPAALLGVIICAVMFPILGRPRKLRARSVSDFGLHTEAVGRMLHDARDAAFAHSVLNEYFAKVREEPSPTWFEQWFAPENRKGSSAKGSSAGKNTTPPTAPSAQEQSMQVPASAPPALDLFQDATVARHLSADQNSSQGKPTIPTDGKPKNDTTL